MLRPPRSGGRRAVRRMTLREVSQGVFSSSTSCAIVRRKLGRAGCGEDSSSEQASDLMQVGISAIEYALGSDTVSVEELEARGLLDSPAARLSEFGFSCARLSRESSHTLATAATSKLLGTTGVDRTSIDALFYAGATPSCPAVETHDPLSAF